MCGTPGVRKGRQITSKFRECVRNISDTLRMPANPGRKPSYQHRVRNTTEPDIVVDRIKKSTSGNSQHCTTSSTISFRDPRATAEKEFELHHHTNLPKSVSKCQENCSRPIKVEKVMVAPSYGRIAWTDKSTGKEKAEFCQMYILFHENCLNNFSEIFYAQTKIDPETLKKLTEEGKTLLSPVRIK